MMPEINMSLLCDVEVPCYDDFADMPDDDDFIISDDPTDGNPVDKSPKGKGKKKTPSSQVKMRITADIDSEWQAGASCDKSVNKFGQLDDILLTNQSLISVWRPGMNKEDIAPVASIYASDTALPYLMTVDTSIPVKSLTDVFKRTCGFSLLDAPGIEEVKFEEPSDEWTGVQVDKNGVIEIVAHLFYSGMDLFYCFEDAEYLKKYVIPAMEKVGTRTMLKGKMGPRGINRSLILPGYFVKIGTRKNSPWLPVRLKLVDTKGLVAGSLNNLMKVAGLPDNTKKLTDNFAEVMKERGVSWDKGQMLTFLKEAPGSFLEYAMGDVMTADGKGLMQEIIRLIGEKQNQVSIDTVGVPRKKTIMTMGSHAARLLADYVAMWTKKNIGVSVDMVKSNDMSGGKAITRYFQGIPQYRHIAEVMGATDGGRCVREREVDEIWGRLVDTDLAGCYGTSLASMSLPVGKPVFVGDEGLSLGQFIKLYKKHLVPGAYHLRVDTGAETLSFSQDLILSKASKDIQKILADVSEEGTEDKFKGDASGTSDDSSLFLCSNQIKKGTITAYELEMIDDWLPVGSVHRKEFFDKVKVLGAVIYSAKSMIDTSKKVTRSQLKYISESQGVKVTSRGFNETPGAWINVPLAPLMNTLTTLRGNYTKKTPMNEFYKLTINCVFGTMASLHFDQNVGVSNTTMAQNITSRARCMTWLMSKTLGTVQSITDGGIFSLDSVIFWNDSHRTLANAFLIRSQDMNPGNIYDDNRNLIATKGTLSGVTDEMWKDYEHSLKAIDTLIRDHVFSQVNAPLLSDFKFDSKPRAYHVILHSKANYCQFFETINGKDEKPKITHRGQRGDKCQGVYQAVSDGTPTVITYVKERPIGVKEWNKAPERFDGKLPFTFIPETKFVFSHIPRQYAYPTLSAYIDVNNEMSKLTDEIKDMLKSGESLDSPDVKYLLRKLSLIRA